MINTATILTDTATNHSHQTVQTQSPITATKHSHQTVQTQPPTTATKHNHQSQPPNTATNHSHQTQPPTTATKHNHQSQPPNTATNHSHQSQSPITVTNHSHQSQSPISHLPLQSLLEVAESRVKSHSAGLRLHLRLHHPGRRFLHNQSLLARALSQVCRVLPNLPTGHVRFPLPFLLATSSRLHRYHHNYNTTTS